MTSAVCCPLEGSDGEALPTCFNRAVRVARAQHNCTECRESITPGKRYEYVRGMWDGSWMTVRTCLSCVEIRSHFACDGWIYGQLWFDLEENFFPDMKAGGPCMDGLSPEAKARMFERRLKWLEDSQ